MKTKRPTTLLAVAQMICALAILPTLFLTLRCNFEPALLPTDDDRTISWLAWLLNAILVLRDVTISFSFVWAEFEAMRFCGRLRTSSAFSDVNVRALGRVARVLTIAGAVSLLGNSIVPWLLTGLPEIAPVIRYLLLPFTLLTLALMVRAVQVLMRRAVVMQEETDLTV